MDKVVLFTVNNLIIISEVKPSFATTIQSDLKNLTSNGHSERTKWHPLHKRPNHLAFMNHVRTV
jgi:hypothetical protein